MCDPKAICNEFLWQRVTLTYSRLSISGEFIAEPVQPGGTNSVFIYNWRVWRVKRKYNDDVEQELWEKEGSYAIYIIFKMKSPWPDSPRFLIGGFPLSIDLLEEIRDLVPRGVTDRDLLVFDWLCRTWQ